MGMVKRRAAVLRPFDKLRVQDDGRPRLIALLDQVLIFSSFRASKLTTPPPTRLVV